MKNIVYEDKDIIIYNKPSGMLTQSDKSFDLDLMSKLKTYLVNKGEKPQLHVINRLDRPVSGLVLFAKNKEKAAKLTADMQEGRIEKCYYAVVMGIPCLEEELEDYIYKDSKTNTSRIVDKNHKEGKRARLWYKRCATKDNYSLVWIKLYTGRHHQIRVQFASRGYGLLGDTKYNTETTDKRFMGVSLCSAYLKIGDREFTVTPTGGGFEYFKEELETI